MARKKKIFTPEFEEAMSVYPGRFPDNPRRTAFEAFSARVEGGIPAAALIAAARNYRDYCRRSGREGTEMVLMAQTFYGPNERFKPFLPKPAAENGSDAPVAPRRPIPAEVRPSAEEGLVSIRGILEGLAKAKVSPVKGLKVTEG
jgi:hypothetical protein